MKKLSILLGLPTLLYRKNRLSTDKIRLKAL